MLSASPNPSMQTNAVRKGFCASQKLSQKSHTNTRAQTQKFFTQKKTQHNVINSQRSPRSAGTAQCDTSPAVSNLFLISLSLVSPPIPGLSPRLSAKSSVHPLYLLRSFVFRTLYYINGRRPAVYRSTLHFIFLELCTPQTYAP